jgi:uncharacterized membrane protein
MGAAPKNRTTNNKMPDGYQLRLSPATSHARPHWNAARPIRAAGAALFLAMLAHGTSARADFRLCNDTKSLVGVALGYREDGNWITEGWWQIPGETCASLIEGDLDSRFYYIYAEDADKGGQWRGDIFMCTADREFRVSGVEDCFARGYNRTGFFEIDTSTKESWMVRLTDQGTEQGNQ